MTLFVSILNYIQNVNLPTKVGSCSVAMGGMIVLGIRWVYGGEMGSLTQKLLSTVAGVSLLVFAIDFVAGLFGVSAALIAQ